ncbi:MAG TPA: vanadium-dependent haloperoxidase [Anaerolineales bacterium]|nr:vanadium-dependent haloperoxidase [Anaerolineales bacterium]
MIQIVRIPLLLFVITSLPACAPAIAPTQTLIQAAPTVDSATNTDPSLQLAPLDSTQVRTDLDALIELQDSRTQADADLIRKWHAHPVIAWNEQSRYWVSYYGMDPVVASRVYALTSVAQQRALDTLVTANIDLTAREPKILDGQITPASLPADPFESAVLIGATEPVFLYLFKDTPKEIKAVFEEARRALLVSGNILPGDLESAETFGAMIAEELINERMEDGASNAREFDPLPTGEGLWAKDPFRPQPEQPNWSRVTPWLLTSPDQFRAPPPPAFGSAAYQAAVDEVRVQQVNNTHAQLAVAQQWADKRFTYTPPGHWNGIAADLIARYSLSERDAAHVFAALNMAQMDAGIACWDSKYHYMVVRPWQADPQIAGLVGYPNHPSYPSGHGTFSSAAAVTLAYFFPADQETLWQMAEEASISRFYGGIHFLFDLEAGKEMGRQVGGLAKLYAARLQWDPYAP